MNWLICSYIILLLHLLFSSGFKKNEIEHIPVGSTALPPALICQAPTTDRHIVGAPWFLLFLSQHTSKEDFFKTFERQIKIQEIKSKCSSNQWISVTAGFTYSEYHFTAFNKLQRKCCKAIHSPCLFHISHNYIPASLLPPCYTS